MREIDIYQLQKLKQALPELVIMDCRGADYWRWERIPGSVNLRWKYVADRALSTFPDTTTPIATYCDGITCTASSDAYRALEKLGYSSLYEYSGGISDWKAHDCPTDSDSAYKLAKNVYAFSEQRFHDSLVNSYLIEEDDQIILVDGPQQITEENEDFILNFGKPIEIILTHAATGANVAQLTEQLKGRVHLHQAEKQDSWLTFKPDRWLKGGEKFGANLSVIHTPGHSAGSITVYDSQNKFLFTGDHLAGDPDGKLRDVREDLHARGSIEERLKSVALLSTLDFEAILPFHYQKIRSAAKQALKNFMEEI